MQKEIKNRVAASALITIDLEDFYPKGPRKELDIAPWLFKNLILKEKDFRNYVKTHNWEQYKGYFLALKCSSDAILPAWTFLLVTLYAAPYAKKVVVGDLTLLETIIFAEVIQSLDLTLYKDKPVIIKGCSLEKIPENAYVLLVQHLRPIVRSILFGEACSTVPLLKNKQR